MTCRIEIASSSSTHPIFTFQNVSKIHSLIIYREGLDTLSILPNAHPKDGLMMNRMAVLYQNSGVIRRSTTSALVISLRLRPWDISRVSGNLLAWGMDFPFYHHLQGRIGFNTVNPSLSTGKDYPVHSLMMNRMAILHRARSTDTMIITKTKTKAKCFQDPTCATFFKGLCV